MRKGLTQTLMAVAVVMMAAQAMAMAPTIGDIPSPVVGDEIGVTDSDLFVYPDAFDLTKFGYDRETPQDQIIWTYEIIGTPQRYSINGAPPVTSQAEGTTPTAAQIIAGPGANDLDSGRADPDPNTITIRDIILTPDTTPPTYAPDAGTTGTVVGSQLVIFYASDLNESTGTDGIDDNPDPVWFYTMANVNDHLSPGGGEEVFTQDMMTTQGEWASFWMNGFWTPSYSASTGMCMNTTDLGQNLGRWTGPFGMLQLAQNGVYQIRVALTSDQTGIDVPGQANRVPFWDLIINNYGYQNPQNPDPATLMGMNLYGSNSFFLDHVGGANAPHVTKGLQTYELWWTPAPVSTSRWNSDEAYQPGPWHESNAEARHAFVEWRVMDDDQNPNIMADLAKGTMCLQSVGIKKYDLNQLHVISGYVASYDCPNLTPNVGVSTTGTVRLDVVAGVEIGPQGIPGDWTDDVVLSPDPADVQSMFVNLDPGDFNFSYTDPVLLGDNYPVTMAPQQLFLIEFELSAPTQNDMDYPPDMYWLGADTVTNELINLSYITLQGWHHGMPDTTPQKYKAFFHSNYATADTNPAYWNAFRPRFMLANNTGLGGGEPNTGGIKISSIMVNLVEFQDSP
jgi:hypothetical protein